MTDGAGTVNSIVSRMLARHDGRMIRISVLLAGCVALSACAPLSIYYKPGAEVAQLQDDQLRCETEALRDAPVANQTRQEPPVYVPPRRSCDSAGHCVTYGGYWQPGQIYSVDVNRDLRTRLTARCMAARGYTPVEIPRCDPGVRASGQTRVLPPLSPRSCAIRNDDGSFTIVDVTG